MGDKPMFSFMLLLTDNAKLCKNISSDIMLYGLSEVCAAGDQMNYTL